MAVERKICIYSDGVYQIRPSHADRVDREVLLHQEPSSALYVAFQLEIRLGGRIYIIMKGFCPLLRAKCWFFSAGDPPRSLMLQSTDAHAFGICKSNS